MIKKRRTHRICPDLWFHRTGMHPAGPLSGHVLLHFPHPARIIRPHLDHERVRKLALHLRDVGDEEDPGEAGLFS